MNHAGKRTCVMSVRATVNRGNGRGRTGNGNGKKKNKRWGMHAREDAWEEKCTRETPSPWKGNANGREKHAKGKRNPRRNEEKKKKNRIEKGPRD